MAGQLEAEETMGKVRRVLDVVQLFGLVGYAGIAWGLRGGGCSAVLDIAGVKVGSGWGRMWL